MVKYRYPSCEILPISYGERVFSVKVREVRNEPEQKEAFQVRQQVFVEEQNVPPGLEIDELEQEAFHFVLYDEDQAVGAARLRLVDDYGKAERVCVLPSHRQSGAGRLLMEALEQKALEKGASAMKLNAQHTAVPFYKKLKYDVTSEEFMDAGIPHFEMKKALPVKGGL